MLPVRLGEGEWGGRNDDELGLVCNTVWSLRGDELPLLKLNENGGRGEGRASPPLRSRKDLLELALEPNVEPRSQTYPSIPVRSCVVS